MWDIIRIPHQYVRVALCFEDEDEMILNINNIIFLCRLTCDSWLPLLRASEYEFVGYM